jgi:SAM-dependent methyltransferase
MPAAAKTPALERRKSYRAPIQSGDYFMVRRIEEFTHRQLAARLRPAMIVLDVGCGEQPLRTRVEEAGGCYSGADVAQNTRATVDYLCPITALPIASDSVDLILCTEVLEHVPETQPALRELARVLRPGGVIILTTPLLYPLHEEPHDFVRLTPFQIERCAVEAGLETMELERAGNEFEVLASVFERCWGWIFDVTKFKPLRRCGAIAIGWMQAIVNGFAIAAGKLIPREKTQRVFLNTMCVLRKTCPSTAAPLA